MLLSHRKRSKEVRETHFEIPSPKYFAPFSPIILRLKSKCKVERVTHFEIPSPKLFTLLSPILFFHR